MEQGFHVVNPPQSLVNVNLPVESAEAVGLLPPQLSTNYLNSSFAFNLFHLENVLVAYTLSWKVTAKASAAHAWDLTPNKGPGSFLCRHPRNDQSELGARSCLCLWLSGKGEV